MNLNLPLAELGPAELGVLIPIIALIIPIVAMLVKHQQRMTEIIHGTASQHANTEIAQLRQEVYELKQLVHQQTIALDSYSTYARMPVEAPLQQRLERGG